MYTLNMTDSATKFIQINRPIADAYGFIAEPNNMPRWAIHNVKAIRDGGNGRWELDTPCGKGGFVPRFEKSYGILDHDFIDPNEGFWAVTARIVPLGILPLST